MDGELWHGTWEGDDADIRQVDPETGEVLTRLTMPEGTAVSGLESDQRGLFYAGGGESGRVRAVAGTLAIAVDAGGRANVDDLELLLLRRRRPGRPGRLLRPGTPLP